jgi:hypothetical protein
VVYVVDSVLEHRGDKIGVSRHDSNIQSMDGNDEVRWFWGMNSLPGDADDRGGHGGEAGNLEVLWLPGDCLSEFAVTNGEIL